MFNLSHLDLMADRVALARCAAAPHGSFERLGLDPTGDSRLCDRAVALAINDDAALSA